MHFIQSNLKKWPVLSFFFTLGFFLPATFANVYFDPGPGTGAPPVLFKSFAMQPFAPDPSALGAAISSLPSPAPCGSGLSFSTPGSHRRIGQGWATWSHGYTGDVYQFYGTSTTINLPPGTRSFYFYAESNNFSTYTATAVANDGTTSGPISINGNSGAKFIGFYATGSKCLLKSITITFPPAAAGFAIGEFGISCLSMVPTMGEWGLILMGLVLFAIAGVFMTRRKLVLSNGMSMESDGGFSSGIVFDRKLFMKSLAIVWLSGLIGFGISIFGFGYSLTGADVPGFSLSSIVLAFIVQLGIQYSNREE